MTAEIRFSDPLFLDLVRPDTVGAVQGQIEEALRRASRRVYRNLQCELIAAAAVPDNASLFVFEHNGKSYAGIHRFWDAAALPQAPEYEAIVPPAEPRAFPFTSRDNGQKIDGTRVSVPFFATDRATEFFGDVRCEIALQPALDATGIDRAIFDWAQNAIQYAALSESVIARFLSDKSRADNPAMKYRNAITALRQENSKNRINAGGGSHSTIRPPGGGIDTTPYWNVPVARAGRW